MKGKSMPNLKPHREPALVLLADDEDIARILMRASLERAGFAVEETEDGEAALAAFQKLQPDIVLLDVVMPNMDGIEACARIRCTPGGEQVPVVIVTGLDDIESISRAYEAGATDFITKPIQWMVLQHRVRYMLRASRALVELSHSRTRLAEAQRIACLGNWEWDIERDRVICSREASRIYGLESAEFCGPFNACLGQMHPEDRKSFDDALERALCSEKSISVDYRIVLSDGSERFVHQQMATSFDPGGRAQRMAGTIQDITQRKQNEEQIQYLAYHDTLTGLPNRHYFKQRLKQALAHAQRHSKMLALLFLDLDRFKRINDTLGHDAGDLLLQTVSDLLVHCVREDDTVERPNANEVDQSVVRLGGDEFTVILTDVARIEDVARVAQRVLDALSRPISLGSHEVFVTVSIGIAIYPANGRDMESLLKNADIAMYHAKEQGRNNYQFFAESMNEAASKYIALEAQFRRALENNELLLYYQPQISVRTGRVVGAEALLRWHHPERGLLLPQEFIPLADDTGLIVPVGEWVLRTACSHYWKFRRECSESLRLNVNLSGCQFRQDDLLETVASILNENQMEPHCLGLEITESVIMESKESAVALLHGLKSLGADLLVDNFGTGYSSLSYLKRFPVDALKVDRSFVREIPDDSDSVAITAAIVAMAKKLRLEVIAEGVEWAQQRIFLMEQGCDVMQGDLLSPPLPVDEFIRFVHDAQGSVAEAMAPGFGSGMSVGRFDKFPACRP